MATNNAINNTLPSGITVSGGAVAINSGTSAFGLSTDASATTVSIANGGAVKAITIGSTNTTSSMVLQSGSGNIVHNTGLTVDSSGRTTNGAQPAFYAYNSAGATNVTGDSTAYTVVFDTAVINQGSYYNTGTSLFTAPITGLYFFATSIDYNNIAAGHTTAQLSVQVTGTSSSGSLISYNNPAAIKGGGSTVVQSASLLIKMTSADTAKVVLQVVGSTKTIGISSGTASSPACTFAGYLVC